MDNSIGALVLFTCIGFVGLFVLWLVLRYSSTFTQCGRHFLVAGQLISFFAIKGYLQRL